MNSKIDNHIDFAYVIWKDQKRVKGESRAYYSLRKYRKIGSYYILIYIGEHVTLVQLIYYLGNVNYSISVDGYWIFDSNYEKALVLTIE